LKPFVKNAGDFMKNILLGAFLIATSASASASASVISDFEQKNTVTCEVLNAQNSSWATSAYYRCTNEELSNPNGPGIRGQYLVYTMLRNGNQKLKAKFCPSGVLAEYQDKLIGWNYRCAKH
jgi:opacity protein-like surface antigen